MKKKAVHIWIRISIFLGVLAILFVFGVLWWINGIAPVDPANKTPVRFVIHRGDSVRSIASDLHENDLIRSPTVFFVLVKMQKIDGKIQAGEFRLNQSMDAFTIANELQHGIIDVWVTTLEGWRVEEIAMRLSRDLNIPEQEFLRIAREGYMFPDTYLVPRTASASAVSEMFSTTFNQKVTDLMKTDAQKVGLSFDQVVTLASIVEREGKSSEDKPIIAGILLKRLRAEWPLQTDATVQYALGYQSDEKSWWKKSLTREDLAVESPYNTYLNTGLPPAPISNPGLESIQAVIYPQESEYWYYLHDQSGAVYYARTLEEHNENITRYLGD